MAFTAKILSWRFRHLNIVGCLLKRRPTKGGSRAPQDIPPPSYALAKSLKLIFEISANYRLVSYLLADNGLICRLRAQCMISNINSGFLQRIFVVIFFKSMYNKTIIRSGFCDILSNQGLGKCYQLLPSAPLIILTSTLIIKDITKTSSNNCLLRFSQTCEL